MKAASLFAGSLGREAGLDWDGWALLQVPSTAPPGTSPVMSQMRGAQKCKHQRCSCPTGWSKSSEAGEGWEGMRGSQDPGPETHSPTTPEFFCCCFFFFFKCRKLGSLKRYENHHASLLKRVEGEPLLLYFFHLFFYDHMQFDLQKRNHVVCILLFPVIMSCTFS